MRTPEEVYKQGGWNSDEAALKDLRDWQTESFNAGVIVGEEKKLTKGSLLDEFAMRFAPELIKRNTGCGTSWEHVAKDAYEAAEAMLNESKRHSAAEKVGKG